MFVTLAFILAFIPLASPLTLQVSWSVPAESDQGEHVAVSRHPEVIPKPTSKWKQNIRSVSPALDGPLAAYANHSLQLYTQWFRAVHSLSVFLTLS